MTDETQNEAGLAEIAGEASETASTALALNSQETLKELQKEVHEEFVTSDREVYKEGLRSLTIQEQKLRKQIAEIEREIAQVHEAKQALDHAFVNGELHSAEDARGVVRTVASRSVDRAFD